MAIQEDKLNLLVSLSACMHKIKVIQYEDHINY